MKLTKKKREELKREKDKLFKRLGIPQKFKSTYKVPFPDYKVDSHHETSDNIDGGCFKKDSLSYRWKKGCEETAETISEIESKRKRVAPLFNKAGYQYITPESDTKTIGRK